MFKSKLKFLFLILFIIACGKVTSAQQLVYHPVNPSFGGNPYNASWLLSEAQAQNTLTDGGSSSYNPYSSNPLDDFKASLNRQILSQISRNLLNSTLGTDGTTFKPGHYEIGDYSIDIVNGDQGVDITIMDLTNGSQTNIVVPNF